MSKIAMSFADSLKFKPEHPERTAKKCLGWNVEFQIWSNRKAMAKSIRMQQKRANSQSDWIPLIPLTDIEGY